MNPPIKCLIVDDEPLAAEVLRDYVGQVPQLSVVDICHDSMQAFEVINREPVDLLFLDVEMPKMNGIEFIKSISQKPEIILTTAFREYALDGYEIEVLDFLLKPISFGRFFKSVNKYLKQRKQENPKEEVEESKNAGGSIYVYSGKKHVKVYLDKILYIESIKDYVRIHTLEKNIISKDTISRYEKLLPASFIRIHRSYIVNSSMISAFTHQDIEIGKIEIPIGASYKKAVIAYLKKG
ncbi:MAG: LytTR family DNA-binding domain-containing protein [Bacteroidota bacterium]